MSNRQFWSFLDLDFIYNTTFAKLFYKASCDFNDNTKLEYIKFMDYSKFVQFVAVFTKSVKIDGSSMSLRDMRLRYIFKIFDSDNNEEVDRLEFRNIITAFVEMILTCKFDSDSVQELIKSLNSEATNASMMEKVLDQYVDGVYNQYSYSGELLTYEEWEKWIQQVQAIEKFLDFTGILKYS
jgi:Ca2+-binding EF-hand superfamily protein